MMQARKDIVHDEDASFDQVAALIKDGKNAEAESILQGSNLHQKTSTSENLTLLHIAAEAGNKEMTRHLIGLGSDVEAKTAAGSTPLMLAVENERESVVATLLWTGKCKYDYINAMSKIPQISDTKSIEFRIYHMIFQAEMSDYTDSSEFRSFLKNANEIFAYRP